MAWNGATWGGKGGNGEKWLIINIYFAFYLYLSMQSTFPLDQGEKEGSLLLIGGLYYMYRAG